MILGYKENKLQPKVFDDVPKYGAYLKKQEPVPATPDMDSLVKQITDQVMSAMGG